ncbi:MAG: phosphatase PAP2 family protein, partial [Muribaculaceae bacterium]|nr:phosphatase PAP2 family protein [Muribaculaceae bacterium]
MTGMLQFLSSLDDNILLFFQDTVRNPVLTPAFRLITTLGNGGAIWIVLALILLILPKTRKTGYMTAVSLLGTLLVNNMLLKNLVARTRPYEVIEGLTYLVRTPSDYSFPSGHAGCSFAVACVMYRRLPKRYGLPALVLAVLISISRLY